MRKIIDPRSRTRNKQVRRVLNEIALLQRRFITPSEMARTLKISPRTISRDLAAITYAQIRLTQEPVPWKSIRL